MLGQAHGLGGLQMRAAGQDVPLMLGGAFDQHGTERGGALPPDVQPVGHEKAEAQTHLIIAAAAGVQLFAHIAGQFGEPGLDVHVHVFQFRLPDKAAGLDLGAHPVQAVRQNLRLFRGDHALAAQHAGVSPGSADILGVERPVVGLGIRIAGHGLFGAFGETASPTLIGFHRAFLIAGSAD